MLFIHQKMTQCISWIRESVTAKVMVVVIAALAIVVSIYSHLLLQSRQQWLKEQVLDSQVMMNQRILESFEDNQEEGHAQTLQQYFDSVAKSSPSIEARIVNLESQIIFSTNPTLIGQNFGTGDTAVSEDRRVRYMAAIPTRNSCRNCHLQTADVMGSVVIDYPEETIEKPLRRDRLYLASYAIAIVLMVSATVMLLMWVVVYNPLSRLSRSVQAVQEGDLEARCVIEGKDQFFRLGEGFNAMVESINKQRKELKDLHTRQIAQADRLASIGKLASGLAHEIKNPLHGINSALTVVARRVQDPGLQEVVTEIQSEPTRVTDLLNNMLAYARPSRPSFAPSDLKSIVDKSLVLLHADLEEQGLKVELAAEPDLPSLELDAAKIQQVLLNLLLNAIQVSKEGDTITIAINKVHGELVTRVCDHGPGISDELAAQIFEPFYTTKSDGTGLGLAITRTLVEQHNGSIKLLQNDCPGACFEIRLPIQHEDHVTQS